MTSKLKPWAVVDSKTDEVMGFVRCRGLGEAFEAARQFHLHKAGVVRVKVSRKKEHLEQLGGVK